LLLTIVGGGRLRAGPAADLAADDLRRCDRGGRARGLGPGGVVVVAARRGRGRDAEAALIASALPRGAQIVALDERGRTLTSPEFAETLRAWADSGTRDLAMVVGGADGVAPDLRAQAGMVLSFGPMVWPHMLARVMLAEQLYRAASILAGSPYHRV
jgi:23S rRNA (pseudouridine1915-N3)-methyltransferase